MPCLRTKPAGERYRCDRLSRSNRLAEPTGVAPHTLQIGDNNQIVDAPELRLSVIFAVAILPWEDRRTAGTCVPSCAAGLPNRATMVLNIGGIANLSLLIPGQPEGATIPVLVTC